MARQCRSDVMASIHEMAENLHAAGTMDKRTLRQFDEACLTPVRSLTAAEIRAPARRSLLATSTSPRGWSASGRGGRSTRKAPRSSCSPWLNEVG